MSAKVDGKPLAGSTCVRGPSPVTQLTVLSFAKRLNPLIHLTSYKRALSS